MENETIANVIEILNYATENKVSPQRASLDNGRGKNYVSSNMSTIKEKYKKHIISREDYQAFVDAKERNEESKNNKKHNPTKNIVRNQIVVKQAAEKRNVAPENQDIHEFVLANMSLSSREIVVAYGLEDTVKSKQKIAGIKAGITKNGGQVAPKAKTLRTKNAIENNVPDLTKEELEDLTYNADTDKRYDERSKGEIIRGKDEFKAEHGRTIKRITGYKYRIMIRGEADLAGSFSREEMDSVYRLYSNMDGAGLTLRALTREFPNLSFREFKRILRAFNITKSSLAVAPHIKEELTEDEMTSLIMRNKENSVLKKLDN